MVTLIKWVSYWKSRLGALIKECCFVFLWGTRSSVSQTGDEFELLILLTLPRITGLSHYTEFYVVSCTLGEPSPNRAMSHLLPHLLKVMPVPGSLLFRF